MPLVTSVPLTQRKAGPSFALESNDPRLGWKGRGSAAVQTYAPFRAFGSSTDRCFAAFAVLLLLARASPRQVCSFGEAKPLNLTVASWGVRQELRCLGGGRVSHW